MCFQRILGKRTAEKFKKRKLLFFSGSISLALCIAMPAVLFLFSGVLRECRRDRMEVNLARAASAASETALALYDRDLYRTFGLFGLKTGDAEKAISEIGFPEGEVTQHLAAEEPLYESDALRHAVARHMSYRSVLSLVRDAVDKIGATRGWSDQLSGKMLMSMAPEAPENGYGTVDPDLPEYDETPEWLGEYNDYMNDHIRSVYQESLSCIAPVIAPDENGSAVSMDVRPFEPGGLETLGKFLDRVFAVIPESLFDRVMLAEYALNYFSNEVPFVVRKGREVHDTTPDGRALSGFQESRKYELERIAMGLEGKASARAVRWLIGAIRSAVHLIHITTDAAERDHYHSLGAAISAAVEAITGGQVVIPSESVSWILITAAAIVRGSGDTKSLLKGQEVPLWPGEHRMNIPMRYRDYLRLILLLQPERVIAERMVSVVSGVFPGPYYTSARCAIVWKNVRVEHAARYLSRQEEPVLP